MSEVENDSLYQDYNKLTHLLKIEYKRLFKTARRHAMQCGCEKGEAKLARKQDIVAAGAIPTIVFNQCLRKRMTREMADWVADRAFADATHVKDYELDCEAFIGKK